MSLQIHRFWDHPTGTLTYVVWDRATRAAVVIDPVYSPDSIEVSQFIIKANLRVEWIMDTHAHADHLTASRELRAAFPGARWAMSERLSEVFAHFQKLFAWPPEVQLKDLGVDRWLADGEEIQVGPMCIQVLATPGHTPACVTYRIGDHLFTGDALLMPDAGTGRCDFPGGSAETLYDSIWRKLYALPDHLSVHVGHDYELKRTPRRTQVRLGEHKQANVHLKLSTAREDYVRFRVTRDKSLNPPKLLEPSLDWNLGAHRLNKAAGK